MNRATNARAHRRNIPYSFTMRRVWGDPFRRGMARIGFEGRTIRRRLDRWRRTRQNKKKTKWRRQVDMVREDAILYDCLLMFDRRQSLGAPQLISRRIVIHSAVRRHRR